MYSRGRSFGKLPRTRVWPSPKRASSLRSVNSNSGSATCSRRADARGVEDRGDVDAREVAVAEALAHQPLELVEVLLRLHARDRRRVGPLAQLQRFREVVVARRHLRAVLARHAVDLAQVVEQRTDHHQLPRVRVVVLPDRAAVVLRHRRGCALAAHAVLVEQHEPHRVVGLVAELPEHLHEVLAEALLPAPTVSLLAVRHEALGRDVVELDEAVPGVVDQDARRVAFPLDRAEGRALRDPVVVEAAERPGAEGDEGLGVPGHGGRAEGGAEEEQREEESHGRGPGVRGSVSTPRHTATGRAAGGKSRLFVRRLRRPRVG